MVLIKALRRLHPSYLITKHNITPSSTCSMTELKISKPSSVDPSANKSPRQWHVILDFDGTITAEDTIDTLVYTSISIKHPSLSNSELRETREAKAWEICKNTYVQELQEYSKAAGRSAAEPHGNQKQSSIKEKVAFLDGLRPVELASVERVGKSGIFREVTPSQLRQRAREAAMGDKSSTQDPSGVKAGGKEKILIRKGFREFIGNIETRGLRSWGVVSVNWSREWIRGALDAALDGEEGEGKRAFERVDVVPVMSNEIDATTGAVEGYTLDIALSPSTHILTNNDKFLAMQKMLSQFSASSSSSRPLSIYIGDSATDLSCLLAADVGIIMQSSRSGRPDPDVIHPAFSFLGEYGYYIAPVRDYRKLYMKERSDEDWRELQNSGINRLLCASSFEEILESGMLDDQSWDPKEMRRLNVDGSEGVEVEKG